MSSIIEKPNLNGLDWLRIDQLRRIHPYWKFPNPGHFEIVDLLWAPATGVESAEQEINVLQCESPKKYCVHPDIKLYWLTGDNSTNPQPIEFFINKARENNGAVTRNRNTASCGLCRKALKEKVQT